MGRIISWTGSPYRASIGCSVFRVYRPGLYRVYRVHRDMYTVYIHIYRERLWDLYRIFVFIGPYIYSVYSNRIHRDIYRVA